MKRQRTISFLLVLLMLSVAILPMTASATDTATTEYIWYQDFNEALTDYTSGKGFNFKDASGVSFADGAMVYTTPSNTQNFIDWQASAMSTKPIIKETVTVHLRFKPDDLMLSFGNNAFISVKFGDSTGNNLSTWDANVLYKAGGVSLKEVSGSGLFTATGDYADIDLQLVYDSENSYYNRVILFLNGEKVSEKELTNKSAYRLNILRCFNLYAVATYRVDEWWIAKGLTVSEKSGRYYFAKPLSAMTEIGNTLAVNEYLRALNFGGSSNNGAVPITDGVANVAKENFTNNEFGFFDFVFRDCLQKKALAETVTFSMKFKPSSMTFGTEHFVCFGCNKLVEFEKFIQAKQGKIGIATSTEKSQYAWSEVLPTDNFTTIDVAFRYDGTKFTVMTLYVGGKEIGTCDISSLNVTGLYGFRFLRYANVDYAFKDLKIRIGEYINGTTTALLGYQCTDAYEKTTDGTTSQVYDLRIVAEIPADKIAEITKAGLLITMTVGNNTYSLTRDVTACYDSIIARDGHNEVQNVTASNGNKLIALTICGIPQGTLHKFTVQSYYELNGKSVSNIGSFELSASTN